MVFVHKGFEKGGGLDRVEDETHNKKKNAMVLQTGMRHLKTQKIIHINLFFLTFLMIEV